MRLLTSDHTIIPVMALAAAVLLLPLAACVSAGTTTASELFLVAQRAFDDGFYDVAIRYVEELLNAGAEGNERVQAKLLLGQCYFFKDQYLKAYNIFKTLETEKEFRDATLFWLGETYFKGADYNQAMKYYTDVVENYPRSEFLPQAIYSLGWTYYQKNSYPEASNQFQQLIKQFPDNPLTEDAVFKLAQCEHGLGHYETAARYFLAYLRTYPQAAHLAESYFYLGECLYYSKDYLSAVTYYAKAANVSADDKIKFMSTASMGWCYLRLEKYDLSSKYFLEAESFAVEKHVLTDDVYWGLASLYMEKNDYPEAIQAYGNLLDKFPQSAKAKDAALGRANAYYAQRDFAAAITAYQDFIKRYASNPQTAELVESAHYGLAWTYLKSGDFDQAIRIFEKIISQAQTSMIKVSALTQMGDAYLESGRLTEAITVFDKILNTYPDSVTIDYVQFRLGIALLQTNRLEAASVSFRSLLNNFPKSRYVMESCYYLGIVYYKKADWDHALEFLKKCTEAFQPNTIFGRDAYFLIGLAYFNQKNFQAALETFQLIQKKFKDDPALIQSSEFNAAKCLYHLGLEAEAFKKFDMLIQKYPDTDTALKCLLWLGDYHLEQKEYQPAIELYQKALAQFPSTDKGDLIYFELGQAYAASEEFDQAIHYYQLISKDLHPEIYGKARLAIADIFSRNMPPEEAVETYAKIGAAAPDFKCDALARQGEIFKKEEQYRKAIEVFQRARESYAAQCDYTPAQLLFYTADSYEQLHMTEQAVDSYFKIPYLYEDETEWIIKAYLRIGRLFEDQSKWAQAEKVYEQLMAYKTDEAKYAQERIDWITENIHKGDGTKD